MKDWKKIESALKVLFDIFFYGAIIWFVLFKSKKFKKTGGKPTKPMPVVRLMDALKMLSGQKPADDGSKKSSIGLFPGSSGSNLSAPVPPPSTTGPVPAALTNLIGNLSFFKPVARLQRRQKYLQVALNSTLDEARSIIRSLPSSERILVEAGTPLIKIYGDSAVRAVRSAVSAGTYVVADTKTADLAEREVAMMSNAGANGITCLGVAPIETIDEFIAACQKYNCDSMIDMMNVESALNVLRRLKKLPDVVVLHRGVDESEFSKEKQIPYYQIQQIKGGYNLMVAVAGGDTSREVQRAIFNGADIVVVWKDFYRSSAETGKLAQDFLKEIR